MEISVKTMQGLDYTVIRHIDEDLTGVWVDSNDGSRMGIGEDALKPTHISTALPALPRFPTPADAGLLHRYMAEGIYPVLSVKCLSPFSRTPVLREEQAALCDLSGIGKRQEEITHATFNGKIVDVAIAD